METRFYLANDTAPQYGRPTNWSEVMNLKEIFIKAVILAIVTLSISECSNHKGYVRGYKDAVQGCVDTLEAH